MRMGLPQFIISDNGREFDNQVNENLTSILGIEQRMTTPYHPQVKAREAK